MTYQKDPRSYEDRVSESLAWNISICERLQLETMARASRRSVGEYQDDDWAQLDFRSKVAEVLAKNGLVAKADRYLACSRQVVMLRCKGPEPHEYYSPNYCDLRFCQICAKRQFCRLRAKHSPVLDFIALNPRRGFRLRKITLTSRNTGSLTHEQITTFNHHVKKTLLRLMEGAVGWEQLQS